MRCYWQRARGNRGPVGAELHLRLRVTGLTASATPVSSRLISTFELFSQRAITFLLGLKATWTRALPGFANQNPQTSSCSAPKARVEWRLAQVTAPSTADRPADREPRVASPIRNQSGEVRCSTNKLQASGKNKQLGTTLSSAAE